MVAGVAMSDTEWTAERLDALCDAANRLTPDQMRRQIRWFDLLREHDVKCDDEKGVQ